MVPSIQMLSPKGPKANVVLTIVSFCRTLHIRVKKKVLIYGRPLLSVSQSVE